MKNMEFWQNISNLSQLLDILKAIHKRKKKTRFSSDVS